MANLDLNTVMLLLIALMNFAGIVVGVLSRKSQSEKLDAIKTQTDGLTSKLVDAEKAKGVASAEAAFAAGGKEERDTAVTEAKLLLARQEQAPAAVVTAGEKA